mmetsp:Transcript_4067/g.9707  ORF Transcript_4067/g.9707 Transcript_4067/m.9707 type:complete len:330 (+) Transcript_4067:1116-2105(+)
MVLLVDDSPSHFVRTLSTFLRKYDFQYTSLHIEAIHFIACLASLVGIRVFDKGETFRLLRVIIPWNVNITNVTDASECLAEVVVGDVWANVANQEGNSRIILVPAVAIAATTTTTTSASAEWRWATPTAGWTVGITTPWARRSILIVMRIIRRRSPPTRSSSGRSVVIAATVIVATPASTVVIRRSAPVSAGRPSPVAMIIVSPPVSISVIASSARWWRAAPGSAETSRASAGPSSGRRSATSSVSRSPSIRRSRSRKASGSASTSSAASSTGRRRSTATSLAWGRPPIVVHTTLLVVSVAAGHGNFIRSYVEDSTRLRNKSINPALKE